MNSDEVDQVLIDYYAIGRQGNARHYGTPDCPQAWRFVDSKANKWTSEELKHFDTGCRFCKRSFDMLSMAADLPLDVPAELAGLVAATMKKGALPQPQEMRVEGAASVLYPVRKATATGKVGMMWQRGTSCRTLSPAELRAMDRTRLKLGEALGLSRITFGQTPASRGGIRTRGGGPSASRKLNVEVLDAAWGVAAAASIVCEVVEGPEISVAGMFRLSLEFDREGFQRYRNRIVICTITVGEVAISFERAFASSRMDFTAEDLPKLARPTPLDLGWLRLYLAPIDHVLG